MKSFGCLTSRGAGMFLRLYKESVGRKGDRVWSTLLVKIEEEGKLSYLATPPRRQRENPSSVTKRAEAERI